MAVRERELHPSSPRHRRSEPEARDAVAVVAVIVASVAMVAALAAVGFAARAVSDSRSRLRQASLVAAGGAGGSTAGAATAPAATALGVTLQTFSITPSQASVPAGLVTLNVTNAAPIGHELLIFQTDLAPDKLPIGSDGRVDEEGAGVQKVFDSGANVDPGKTKTFPIALAAGHYVLVCNLPGHYAGGMHTAFTVTPSAAPVVPLGITLQTFTITPAQPSVPAGLVDLNVTNAASIGHELLIFQTDLAPGKLPIGSDGRVDEGGDGIVKIFDSGANVDAGKTKTFHTALSAGHYVLVCNLPGHYAGGMHTAFTVN
jgi:uncharacterized cupredoxin-like copper-binding protein